MTKFTPSKNVYQDMFNFEKNYWWYEGLRDNLRYFVKKYEHKTVLDAGCGTGANMIEIKKITDQLFGVDISKEAIEIAKKQGLNNLYVTNLVKLPFEDEKFDLAYCMDVFGNLNQDETYKTLNELHRCLKRNGTLIIQTAGIKGLTSSHDKYWDIQKRYSLEELENILLKNNFKIIKKSYRHFFLFPIIALIKITNKSRKDLESGDFFDLPFFINLLLTLIMKFENYLLRYISFPIGSSVFLIVRKN